MPGIARKPARPRLNRGPVIAQRLAAAWPLADRASPTHDHVGSNHLTFNGTTAWGTGPDGPAVRLPGAGTAYLQTARSVLNPATGDFTAAAWFSIDAQTGVAQVIMAQLSGTGTGRNWLSVSAAGPITSFLGGASTTGTTTVAAVDWHLGTVTVKGTTVTVYLDKTQEATATRTLDTNVAALRSGASNSGTTPLTGYVGRAGIMLWNRALTANEVARLYADPYRIWSPRRRPWAAYAAAGSGGPWPWFLDNAMAGGYAPMGM